MASYDMSIRIFDAAVAGLGGCPYARGAQGNLSTEHIVYALENSGIDAAVDLAVLSATGDWISKKLGLGNNSCAGAPLVTKAKTSAEAPKIADPKTSDAATKSKPTSATLLKAPPEWKPTEHASEDLRVERTGSAVKITLARPKKGNSITPSMLSSLTTLYRHLATDPTVFTITLAGDGKFFCMGMDFSEDTDRSSAEGNFYGKVRDLFKAIEDVPQKTIALVVGSAFGGGVSPTFACDVRSVVSTARRTLSEVKLRLQPAVISRFMSREWGFPFAREAMLSGREVSPAELHQVGAMHQVVDDPATLPQALDKYLDVLDQCAPKSGGAIKELIRLAWKNEGGEKQDAFIEEKLLNMMTL